MRCSGTRPGGEPCRRAAEASVSGGADGLAQLITVMCAACVRDAMREVPGLLVRWLGTRRRPARGRAS